MKRMKNKPWDFVCTVTTKARTTVFAPTYEEALEIAKRSQQQWALLNTGAVTNVRENVWDDKTQDWKDSDLLMGVI